LKSLEDYTDLYTDLWTLTEPNGTSVGALTNYTQDLFFSMERLSANPFSIRRLNPQIDNIPYIVEDAIVRNLTGKTLNCLFEEGRLFVADHSNIKPFGSETIEGRYTAFCTALFYICPTKNQLLPLAIKTNTGADLIYTPLDAPNDWLLAKILFNSNDLFHGQMYHLVGTHAVAEIVYLAALRTLSTSHPVFAYLQRGKFHFRHRRCFANFNQLCTKLLLSVLSVETSSLTQAVHSMPSFHFQLKLHKVGLQHDTIQVLVLSSLPTFEKTFTLEVLLIVLMDLNFLTFHGFPMLAISFLQFDPLHESLFIHTTQTMNHFEKTLKSNLGCLRRMVPLL